MTFQRLFLFVFSLIIATTLYAQSEDSTEEGDDTKAKESYIEVPNAFSPNNDGYNDVYRVKKYENIVEFRGIIFNRWGQKLYEWNDVAGEWDGTYNGKLVQQGTYFVLINAKGSDGKTHTIKRDVNVIYRISNNEQQQ